MNVLTVVCPSCGARLSLQEVAGIEDKLLACPVCKFKAKVSVYQLGQAGRGGQGATDSDTLLPNPIGPQQTDTGQIRVIQTGQICPLRMGSQVVGRRAQSSTADVQIGSEDYSDPYMSRRHLCIEVVVTPQGIEHRLEEIGSKNITQLNGKEIKRRDKIVIGFGDKLTLGETDIILEHTDKEATRMV